MAKKRKGKSTGNKTIVKRRSTSKKKGALKSKARKKAGLAPRVRGGWPPHKCETTGISGTCLKFYPDSKGRYVLPAGGERVPCSECKYFF